MHKIFSHAPEPDQAEQTRPVAVRSSALYIQTALPLQELWIAFTEYTHLWWPHELKREAESYLEFGEQYFLEEEEDGTQHILAETEYFEIEDVIALHTLDHELNGKWKSGISFIFDQNSGSTVEISSGLVKPRDLGDSEIGVEEADLESARLILSGFARFMKAELTEERL